MVTRVATLPDTSQFERVDGVDGREGSLVPTKTKFQSRSSRLASAGLVSLFSDDAIGGRPAPFLATVPARQQHQQHQQHQQTTTTTTTQQQQQQQPQQRDRSLRYKRRRPIIENDGHSNNSGDKKKTNRTTTATTTTTTATTTTTTTTRSHLDTRHSVDTKTASHARPSRLADVPRTRINFKKKRKRKTR